MKTHLPSRLRSALLTALASVSIPTLTAASLVTFSTQAAAEYKPAGSFKKEWTKENPDLRAVPNTGTSAINLPNVKLNTYTSSGSTIRYVSLITQDSTEDTIYYAELACDFPTKSYTNYLTGADGANIGSMYIKETGSGPIKQLYAAEGATLSGSTYMELAGNNVKYGGNVYGAVNSTINGSSTIYIQDGTSTKRIGCCANGSTVSQGTFLEIVTGTFTYATAGVDRTAATIETGGTIFGGTHLVVHGGSFSGYITAGSSASNSTIHGGVYGYIEGGTFNEKVIGGAFDKDTTINGGIDLTIAGGTFNEKVIGGAFDGATVNGDIDLTITGGTFNYKSSSASGIYAAGYNGGGTINDFVSLTIRGSEANFGNNYIISAGGQRTYDTSSESYNYNMNYGERVTGKVVLAELTEASSLLKSSSQGIEVRGLGKDKATGREMFTELEMNNVKGKLNAKLSDFTAMKVTNGSELKIDSTNNADLGGVKTISVDGNSTLELEKVTLTTPTTGRTVSVTNGTLNLVGMEQGVDGVSIQLSIDNGTFGVYKDSSANPGADDSNVGNLTLAEGSKITIGHGGGKLEANLTTADGSILDFSSGAALTMGCTVDVAEGTYIVLSEGNFDKLKNGGSVTLFTSVDNDIDMDASSFVIYRGAVDAETLTGQVSFQTDEAGNGMLVTPAPEPTTGTLSLLALAGLCARRRRK